MTICNMTIYDMLFFFAMYSVIGWMIEVGYHAIKLGEVVNRGFLNGPLCPIYGTGMIIIYMVLYGVGQITGYETDVEHAGVVLLFCVGICFCTLVELVTGIIMDKLFNTRWWDYSKEKFNFKGYICLSFSILWGLGSAFVLKFLCPLVEGFKETLPFKAGVIFLIVFYVIFIADLVITVMTILSFTKQLEKMRDIQNAILKLSDGMSEIVGGGTLKTMEKTGEVKDMASRAKDGLVEKTGEVKEKVVDKSARMKEEYEERLRSAYHYIKSTRLFGIGRLVKAFPGMTSTRYKEIYASMRNYIASQKNEKDNDIIS